MWIHRWGQVTICVPSAVRIESAPLKRCTSCRFGLRIGTTSHPRPCFLRSQTLRTAAAWVGWSPAKRGTRLTAATNCETSLSTGPSLLGSPTTKSTLLRSVSYGGLGERHVRESTTQGGKVDFKTPCTASTPDYRHQSDRLPFRAFRLFRGKLFLFDPICMMSQYSYHIGL